MKEALKTTLAVIILVVFFALLLRSCKDSGDSLVHTFYNKCEDHRKYKWPDQTTKTQCIREYPEMSQ